MVICRFSSRLPWVAYAFLSASLLLSTGCGSDPEEPQLIRNPAEPEARPQFLGVARGEAVGIDGVQLSWQPGYDDETAEEDLVYVAYVGELGKPVSLARPLGTSIPGAGTMTITHLPPGDYQFVVRVRDEDGFEDANTASVRVSVGGQHGSNVCWGHRSDSAQFPRAHRRVEGGA